jgi:hypothetical protein
MTATSLSEITPRSRHRVIDLVRAAGVDVSDWSNGRGGPEKAATNPKYCYEWCYVEPGKVAVLNLWHASMELDGTRVVYRMNLREYAENRTTRMKAAWRTRALKMDAAIQLALKEQLPIRVVVCEGEMRGAADPEARASTVRNRLLDPLPWTVTKYDFDTGECTLTRGAQPTPEHANGNPKGTRQASRSTWIFQGNPDRFDLRGYLGSGLDRITWLVRRYSDEIAIGDTVFVWQSAGTAKATSGVIAEAVVDSRPWVGPDHEEAVPFWRDRQSALLPERRVWLRLVNVAEPREVISREWLVSDPVCRTLLIIRQRTGTNFPVEDCEAHRLRALWARTGRDWSRSECIAALLVYDKTIEGPLSKKLGSPVSDLALLLGRAVGGAYNKLLNFRSLDPRDTRAGLSSVGTMDKRVWDEFYDLDSQSLRRPSLEAEFEQAWKDASAAIPADPDQVGADYRQADELVERTTPTPPEPNPDAAGRGARAHAVTQNALARYIEGRGQKVLSPRGGDPQFDLAWWHEDALYVAEVKSTTTSNEEKQLRLGLGQVLRYRHLLAGDQDVRAVLVAESEPRDPSWLATCRAVGVYLVWPTGFDELGD